MNLDVSSYRPKMRAAVTRARFDFIDLIEPLPDTFNARQAPRLGTHSTDCIRIGSLRIPRATWRVWLALGWVFQIEGNKWGKLPAYERARWEE